MVLVPAKAAIERSGHYCLEHDPCSARVVLDFHPKKQQIPTPNNFGLKIFCFNLKQTVAPLLFKLFCFPSTTCFYLDALRP